MLETTQCDEQVLNAEALLWKQLWNDASYENKLVAQYTGLHPSVSVVWLNPSDDSSNWMSTSYGAALVTTYASRTHLTLLHILQLHIPKAIIKNTDTEPQYAWTINWYQISDPFTTKQMEKETETPSKCQKQ